MDVALIAVFGVIAVLMDIKKDKSSGEKTQ
jgi:hypothetical protein